MSLSDVPAMFTDGHLPLDVALVQVAPPDDDGMCSLGVSVDITRAAVLAATTVIAEVNPAMPRTRGDSLIPADRIDHAVLGRHSCDRVPARAGGGRRRADRALRRPPRRRPVHPADRAGPGAQPDAAAPEQPARPVGALRGDHRAGRRAGREGRDHRLGRGQLGDGHPAALRPARVRRPVLPALHRAPLRPGRDRPPRAHGLGHPGVLDRPVGAGVHGTARRPAVRRVVDRTGLPSRHPARGPRHARDLPRVPDPCGAAGHPRRTGARRTRRAGPPAGALGGHRVRHRLPVRQVPRRASPRPDRDRPPRRPARPAGGGAGARHRRRRPAAAQPHGVPRRRGARADAARRTRGSCSGRRGPSIVVPCRSCSTGCPRRTFRRGSSRS